MSCINWRKDNKWGNAPSDGGTRPIRYGDRIKNALFPIRKLQYYHYHTSACHRPQNIILYLRAFHIQV